jgi:hypothetical protein
MNSKSILSYIINKVNIPNDANENEEKERVREKRGFIWLGGHKPLRPLLVQVRYGSTSGDE